MAGKRHGKAEMYQSSDGYFYVVIKAGNGEILSTSEMFVTKQGAEKNFMALASVFEMGMAYVDKSKRKQKAAPLPAQVDFIGQRPPERPPRKPSEADQLQ